MKAPTPDLRSWVWGIGLMLLGGLVAVLGEPEPAGLAAGGGGILTGFLILMRGFEQ